METQLILNDEGSIVAFEIKSWRSGPRMIANFLSNEIGAKVTFRCKWFTREEVHLRFKYDDHDFVLWEPHGDCSRYWICFNDNSKRDADLIEKLQNSFKD